MTYRMSKILIWEICILSKNYILLVRFCVKLFQSKSLFPSARWSGSRASKYCDLGNGLSLVKFTDELKYTRAFEGQPWFVGGQIYSLQRWEKKKTLIQLRRDFTLPSLGSLPRLHLEFWSKLALEKILKPVGKIYKIDVNSEVISRGLFVWECIEVDISKPLKMEIKYNRGGVLLTSLLGYEEITDICYGWIVKITNLTLAFLTQKYILQDWECPAQFADNIIKQIEAQTTIQEANWPEACPKHRQSLV